MAWCVLEEWSPMRSCWPYHWRNVGRFPWQMGGIGDDRFEAKWPHFWRNSRIIVAKLSRIHYSTNRSILVLKFFNCSMQRCWDETFISKDCVFWNLPVVGMLLGIFSHFRLIHLHLGKNKRY